ncbi:hypothetical protein BDR05DRAFT_969780 [Suillus weaverae]|nr:hypothetical protein BDR05DRAFT_969780 [Suillus weaverae]
MARSFRGLAVLHAYPAQQRSTSETHWSQLLQWLLERHRRNSISPQYAGYCTSTPWVLCIAVRLLVGHFLSSHTVLMAVCTPFLHCISCFIRYYLVFYTSLIHCPMWTLQYASCDET